MIEIIPNWHPLFVHFTVALFTLATLFAVFAYGFAKTKYGSSHVTQEMVIVSKWTLWGAGFMAILTVLAGLYAYNTVKHDGISHAAMTIHRNWAIPTAMAILAMTLWSLWRHYRKQSLSCLFVLALVIVEGLVLITAWHGAELVYRYGLGVMSMPQAEEVGHNHHGMSEDASMDSSMDMDKHHTH